MAKAKYEMKIERSLKMKAEEMQLLSDMHLAPFMQLATGLIGKARHAGGNMFRHQMDTLAILIDYGYIDSVLLKASVVHDTVEDIPDFDRKDAILSGVESRTSSPIRILRDEYYESEIKGIYPCGEGAGYAGGIMTAAMDGIKIAINILENE